MEKITDLPEVFLETLSQGELVPVCQAGRQASNPQPPQKIVIQPFIVVNESAETLSIISCANGTRTCLSNGAGQSLIELFLQR